MKKIVIAGGSGYLGQCLSNYFTNQGYHIVILTRTHQLDKVSVHYEKWDAKHLGAWTHQLEGAEALINLTGKSVDCRYTERNKQLIYDSRLCATHVLGEAIRKLKQPPKLWVNAASATIYRNALDREMDEDTGDIGSGFSVDVCKKWEQAFGEEETPDTRKVALRIAIVLGKNGGALQPLKQLTKVGFGGKQGKGNQYFSWLHEEDFCRMIQFLIGNKELKGVYNAAAPNPIPNKGVMKMLRNELGIPFGLPMPEWLLTIGARIIQTETELILKSRRVVPKRLLEAGFQFKHPGLKGALNDILVQS